MASDLVVGTIDLVSDDDAPLVSTAGTPNSAKRKKPSSDVGSMPEMLSPARKQLLDKLPPRPTTAYNAFTRKMGETTLKDVNYRDRVRQIADMWSKLSPEQKQPYEDEAFKQLQEWTERVEKAGFTVGQVLEARKKVKTDKAAANGGPKQQQSKLKFGTAPKKPAQDAEQEPSPGSCEFRPSYILKYSTIDPSLTKLDKQAALTVTKATELFVEWFAQQVVSVSQSKSRVSVRDTDVEDSLETSERLRFLLATGPITGPSAAPKAAPVFSLKATKAEPMEIDDDSDKEISAMKLGMLSPSGDEDSDSAPILSPSHKKA